MARWSRKVLGSVLKGKDGKPNYIKISDDVVLKKDSFLNLENEAFQLKNLEEGVEAGRVNDTLEQKLKESINKIPWYNKEKDTGFVLFQIVKIEKQD